MKNKLIVRHRFHRALRVGWEYHASVRHLVHYHTLDVYLIVLHLYFQLLRAEPLSVSQWYDSWFENKDGNSSDGAEDAS